jgi:thimet oligopeptidase
MSSNLISGTHEELLTACRTDIAWTKAEIEKLKTTKKPAPASALAAFDTAVLRLSDVLSRAGLAEQVLPAKEGRDAARKCTQEASQYLTELQLDRGLFDVIASVDSTKLDAAGKHFHDTCAHHGAQ